MEKRHVRLKIMLLIFGVFYTLALLLTPAQLLQAEQTAKFMPDANELSYMVKAVNRGFYAQCSAELKPDRSVIRGQLYAEDAKPSEAARLLDLKIAKIKEYVESKGGTIVMNERTRAIVGKTPVAPNTDKIPNVFFTAQKLEIYFQTTSSTNIDEVLETLGSLELRYTNFPYNYGGSYTQPKMVVAFRFSDLPKALEQIHNDCKLQAWKNWCTTGTESLEEDKCMAAFNNLSPHLITSSMNLTSQPVVNESGYEAPLQFYYPWQATNLNNITLFGDITLHLSGNINTQLLPPK